MSAASPATGGPGPAQDGGDNGSPGRSRTLIMTWIAATGTLLAAGGLALIFIHPSQRAHHPHPLGAAAAGCGLVPCSAAIPVTHPAAPAPSRVASTRPVVTRASVPPPAPHWFQPPPAGSVPLITMRYRNGPGNSQDGSRLTYVFYTRIPLASRQRVQAVVLPVISGASPVANSPALHIFALTVS